MVVPEPFSMFLAVGKPPPVFEAELNTSGRQNAISAEKCLDLFLGFEVQIRRKAADNSAAMHASRHAVTLDVQFTHFISS